MTEPLQQTRYDHLIRRVGGIIGPGSKVASAVGDLFPMIDVERVPGELLALMDTRVAWGGASQGAVAGLINRIQLFNPAGSGMLITVSRIDVTSDSINIIAMGLVDTQLTNVPNEQYRDGRLGIANLPVGLLQIDTQAAAAPVNWLMQIGSFQPRPIRDENAVAVLTPGTGLRLSTSFVNASLATGWMWRERVAEQSELNL